MCHSAVHSDTHHTGKSCIILSKMLGIHDNNSPFIEYMKLLDKKQIYDKCRQRSKRYKFSRHMSRKRRCYRSFMRNSLYNSSSNISVQEHSYGINLNQWTPTKWNKCHQQQIYVFLPSLWKYAACIEIMASAFPFIKASLTCVINAGWFQW